MRFPGLAIATAVLFAAAGSAGATLPDAFPENVEVRAAHGIARVVLDVILDPVTGVPTFEFAGLAGVVPTIRVRPGDTIALTVRNAMPRVRKGPPDDINVHFHGLAVSPQPPGDEVLHTVAHAGETLEYRVRIPADHEPGLYWYHPHVHGQAYRDVTGGMSGAIVVEGIQQHLPRLGRMRERIVVLRDIATGPRGFVDMDTAMNAPGTMTMSRRTAPRRSGDSCRPEPDLQPTLNRRLRARIAIAAGEEQFFRVLNAAASRYFDLSVDASRLEIVALDGVPLDAYPGTPAFAYADHILLPPAGRAEFVVRGLGRSTVLRSACVDSGAAGDAEPPVILADLVTPRDAQAPAIAPATAPGEPRTSVPAAAGPGAPLAPNVMTQPLPHPALRRTIRFTEDARGFYINGKAFEMRAPPSIVARSGTVEDWTIVNDSDEVHAFHIHQVHFVATAVNGRPLRERYWRDTINVPPRRGRLPGTVAVTVDFRNPVVRGTFLMHCHLLDHEDGGMMTTVRVR